MAIRWSRLGVPLCLFDRHSPVREGAKWDGKYYTGTCRHCGRQVIRRSRGLWRRLREACAER